MRRPLAVLVVAVLALAGCASEPPVAVSSSTVRVGLLHSLTGTTAISETALVNAEKMAIEEINAAGGITVDGTRKKIDPIVMDSGSDPVRFAKKAKELVKWNHVPVVFGGWSSTSRKAVLPTLAEHEALLFFPAPYEGLESSANVVYTGATANQQVVPAMDYLKAQGSRRIFLVGSDDLFPRTANKEIKSFAAANGLTIVGEQYRALGSADFAAIVAKIKSAQPHAIVNTLTGDSNAAFFAALNRAKFTSSALPVLSLTVTEEEVRTIGPEVLAGHLVARNYFQTTSGGPNAKFVQAYKAKFGDDKVTSDPMEAAYVGVHLWAKAVAKAGSTDVVDVRTALSGLSYDAPEGRVTVDGDTHHVSRTARIGVISADGLIDELRNSGRPIAPDPYLKSYSWWKA
ncbi:transporter substrate-binding protein [Cryptosporangium arvum]|uniref:transporter substrate-binding protein n=1 Tax=Cryptosporangium arvum TaxID=80871 RepID=UPI00056AF677|nr:transporter substrate-binding protein [Cryptosporangium arvum]